MSRHKLKRQRYLAIVYGFGSLSGILGLAAGSVVSSKVRHIFFDKQWIDSCPGPLKVELQIAKMRQKFMRLVPWVLHDTTPAYIFALPPNTVAHVT